MGFLAKLKKLLTVQRKRELLEKKDEVVNSSPSLNRRDLEYARRVGRWEELSEQIRTIQANTTVLLERVPDVVLTDKGFHTGIGELFSAVRNLMNSSPDRPQAQAVEKVAEAAEDLALSLREQEILEFLEFRVRSTAWEVGYVVGISRSRCNQILKNMQRRGMLVTYKHGRKIVFVIARKLSQG